MMIRLLTTIFGRHSLPAIPNHIIRYNSLPQNNYFSTQKQHPLIEKLATTSNPKELDQILIEMTNFNDKNREIAIELILQKIFALAFPISVLTDKKFLIHLNKHPALLFEAYFYRLTKLMQNIETHLETDNKKNTKLAVKDTNQSFMICFESLKKVPRDDALRNEVMVQRKFADYYFMYLFQLVEPLKQIQVLTKSRDFYKSCLNKTGALLKQEQEKLKKLSEMMLEVQQTQESRNEKIAFFQQNLVRLIEETSESTFRLLNSQNLLEDKRHKQATSKKYSEDDEEIQIPFKFHAGLRELAPLFKKATENYLLIEKEKKYSGFYHKVKKMALQLGYYSRLTDIQKMSCSAQEKIKIKIQQRKSLLLSLEQLYVETSKHLQLLDKEGKHFRKVEELAILLMSVRLYTIQQKNLNLQQYRNKLVEQVKTIVGILEDDVKRKLLSAKLNNIAKEALDVDAEEQLGRQTRGLKLKLRLKP